jgi:hypothetical protein
MRQVAEAAAIDPPAAERAIEATLVTLASGFPRARPETSPGICPTSSCR